MYDPYGNPLSVTAVEIVPAILTKKFSNIQAAAQRVHGVAKRIQIDVVDGVYAKTGGFFSNRTWPYTDPESFKKIIAEEGGLPYWGEINYEFDLMISEPKEHIMDYVHAGASHIIVHARAKDAVAAVQKLVDLREESGAFSVKAGVALTADAQPEELEQFEAQFDYVQVMGIANIGKQGQKFDERSIHLLERLHARYPQLRLQVDGGVTFERAALFVKAGAASLVAGSAIFGATDASEAFAKLSEIANAIIE